MANIPTSWRLDTAPDGSMRSPEEINKYGKRRLWAVIGSVVAATSVFIGIIEPLTGRSSDERERETTEYVVKPGDTAWHLAEKIDPNSDPRELAYNIEKQNPGNLRVGEVVQLPVSKEK